MLNKYSFLNNQLLIAMPSLDDPYFHRAVIYICEHNNYGATGIIINKPLELKLAIAPEEENTSLKDPQITNIPLFYDGPIQPERGFVIHKPFGNWNSSFMANNEISITTSKDILQAIAKGEGPKDMLIALGYAGWEEHQLEQEILDNFWIPCPISPDIFFNTPKEKCWNKALASIGINPSQLSYDVGHA